MSIATDYRRARHARTLDQLRQDVQALRANGRLEFCALIGSQANDQWTATSDIDLVCVANGPLHPEDFPRVQACGLSMDLFVLNAQTLNERMQDRVFRSRIEQGVVL